MKLRLFRLLPLCAALVCAASASDLPDLGDSALANLPAHEERQIADTVARELRRSGEVLDDVEVADYLERLGYRLVEASNDNRVSFRFFPIQANEINAFAVPGGVVAINTGLVVLTQHESELAAVMAHEIAHVTQHHYARMVESSKGSGLMTLGTLALAILAASQTRNSDAPMAAVAAGQGYSMQRQLDFSRDFEREADRVGMTTLQAAGYDPRAMPSFFERMQKHYRNVDNGAFAFLRTHPVNVERISDSQSRAAQLPYKQWTDSIDYLLVREKVRGQQLGTRGALEYYAGTTGQGKFASAAAQQYGYACALWRAGRLDEAWSRLEAARKAWPPGHAMFDALAGGIRLDQGRYAEARTLFAEGRGRAPSARALIYGEIDVALRENKAADAVALAELALAERGSDPGLHKRLAQGYERQGQSLSSHRAMAEYYALIDEPTAAIQQLQIARRSGGDFYQMSAIEARLKELRNQLPVDAKGRPIQNPDEDRP